MNHALDFHSSKRPGEDGGVEFAAGVRGGKILDGRLDEIDAARQPFRDTGAGSCNRLAVRVDGRDGGSFLSITPGQPPFAAANLEHAALAEVHQAVQREGFVPLWIPFDRHGSNPPFNLTAGKGYRYFIIPIFKGEGSPDLGGWVGNPIGCV